MILTKTPLRASFVGGGSDLPAYYNQGSPGRTLSCSISAYVYVAISRQFNPHRIRVSYSQTENVLRPEDLNHDLIREAMLMMEIRQGIEINTIADVPGNGTGLGSSAAVTVGTLLGLYRYLGLRDPHDSTLAERASDIEIDRLNRPVGKQDQYAVAHGGFNELTFHPGGLVDVRRLDLRPKVAEKVNTYLRMYFTGATRASAGVLADVVDNIYGDQNSRDAVTRLAALVPEVVTALEAGEMDKFGYLLHEAWEHKKKLSSRVTSPAIDQMYEKAMQYGAYGGKLLGAGAGGFLLLVIPPTRQPAVTKALERDPMILDYGVDGTEVVYDDGSDIWNGPR